MIQSLKNIINEDYFSKLASRKDNGNVRKENEVTLDLVQSVIDYNESYTHIESIDIRKTNGNTLVYINGNFHLNKDIEELPFSFGEINGGMDCYASNLTSLKGMPYKVSGALCLNACKKLTSLKGCPEEVGNDFSCVGCSSLESLDGCPKKVGGSFYCSNCGKDETNVRAEICVRCDVGKKIYVE